MNWNDSHMMLWMNLDINAWKLLQEYYAQFLDKVPDAKMLLEENARLRGQLAFVKLRCQQIEEILK